MDVFSGKHTRDLVEVEDLGVGVTEEEVQLEAAVAGAEVCISVQYSLVYSASCSCPEHLGLMSIWSRL